MDRITRIAFSAMNTEVEAQLEHDNEHSALAERDANVLRDWFRDCEGSFSRFRRDSELSSFNSSGGKLVLLSDRLFELLVMSERYREVTDGLFQIGILPELLAAGYDRSFELMKGAGGDNGNSAEPRKEILRSGLELDISMKAARLSGGAGVDLGGIAKSWTTLQAGEWLKGKAYVKAALVNAGGDAFYWRRGREGGAAAFAISSPWNAKDDIGMLQLHDGAVATSSVLGRMWRHSGGMRHHLIDPRTGEPSRSGIVQATVAGQDPVACEVWAKTVCIAGEEGLALMEKQAPGYEVLFAWKNGSIELRGNKLRDRMEWQPFTHMKGIGEERWI
ncbi:FAD:protein FMN transferase [Paenibacillus sp. CAU 1782]